MKYQMIEQFENGLVYEYQHPDYPEYDPMPLSFTLMDSIIPFNLDFQEGNLKVDCPIRIIHGMNVSIVQLQL